MAGDEGTSGPIKAAVEAIKTAADVLHINPEPEPRAGPLVVVGRFYISLTVILATVASVGAFIDWKTFPHEPSPTIAMLRVAVLGSIVLGLALGVLLIIVLMGRNPWLLFSPTELSHEAQMATMGPRTKEESTLTEDTAHRGAGPQAPAAPPPPPAAPPPPAVG